MLLRKYFFILFIAFSFVGFSFSQTLSGKTFSYTTDSINATNFYQSKGTLADSIINYGKIFLHSPYRRGGKGNSSAFDCSGFTSYVYRNFGYKLGASSADQAQQFNTVERSNLKKGDLVFFSGRGAGKRVGHVGIVVDDEKDGKFNFIHASSQHGVIISKSDEPYYMRRFIKAGRVVFNDQMMAVQPGTPTTTAKKLSKTERGNISSPIAGTTTQTEKIIPAQYHRVKKGETLTEIAQEYGLSIAELKQKNNIKGNKITPKQRLKVKDAETVMSVESIDQQDDMDDVLLTDNYKPDTTKVESRLVSSIKKISHIVKKGETLFSISSLYHMPMDQLKQINNMFTGMVHIGQKIIINSDDKPVSTPETLKAESAVKVQSSTKPDAETKAEIPAVQKPETHKVQKGETLYGIAAMYNMSVDDIKKFNNLKADKIKPGRLISLIQHSPKTVSVDIEKKKEADNQKLTHKVKPGETYYSIARQYGCKVNDLKKWNNKSGDKIKTGEKLIIQTDAN